MKTFLILTWLLIAGAGYGGYLYYQQTLTAAAQAQAANEQLKGQVKAIAAELEIVSAQLDDERRTSDSLRKLLANAGHSNVTAATPDLAQPPSAANFPSTITTRTGKTYEGCRLDRAFPDGISIFYHQGVAKIFYPDLDPAFAASFGYNPQEAAKYAQEEAIRMADSDALRSQAVVQEAKEEAAEATATTATPASSPSPGAKPSLTADQRAAIQAQIDSLQSDIAFMQEQEAKLTNDRHTLTTDNASVTSGGYADRISQEQDQVRQLQAQLQ
jgi:hypothetical protein